MIRNNSARLGDQVAIGGTNDKPNKEVMHAMVVGFCVRKPEDVDHTCFFGHRRFDALSRGTVCCGDRILCREPLRPHRCRTTSFEPGQEKEAEFGSMAMSKQGRLQFRSQPVESGGRLGSGVSIRRLEGWGCVETAGSIDAVWIKLC